MNFYEEYVKKHEDKVNLLLKNGNTLVVNVFGGPSAGKSTACLHLTAEMKKLGYNAEYVSEYAKDLVWEENADLLSGSEKTQFIILEEQIRRVDRLLGKVKVVFTDSPILLNAVYNKELTNEYEKMVTDLYSQYPSFNVVVERSNNFEKEGRIHNEEESKQKDKEIIDLLKKNNLFYGKYNHDTIDKIINNVITTLNKMDKEKNTNIFTNYKEALKFVLEANKNENNSFIDFKAETMLKKGILPSGNDNKYSSKQVFEFVYDEYQKNGGLQSVDVKYNVPKTENVEDKNTKIEVVQE